MDVGALQGADPELLGMEKVNPRGDVFGEKYRVSACWPPASPRVQHIFAGDSGISGDQSQASPESSPYRTPPVIDRQTERGPASLKPHRLSKGTQRQAPVQPLGEIVGGVVVALLEVVMEMEGIVLG